MEQRKEKGERRRRLLYRLMPVVLSVIILIAVMIPYINATCLELHEALSHEKGNNANFINSDTRNASITDTGNTYSKKVTEKDIIQEFAIKEKLIKDFIHETGLKAAQQQQMLELWNKTWGSKDYYEYGFDIAVNSYGYIHVTGKIYDPYGVVDSDAFLLKYAPDGTLIWSRTWGGSNDDIGYKVAVADSGYIYVAGWTYSYGAGGSDAFLLKYSPDGTLIRSRTWGGSSNDYGEGIAVDSHGYIYVSVTTYSYGAGGSDVFLLKYDSFGDIIWERSWGGTGKEGGESVAIGSGYIYVTGETDSYGAGDDVFLLKYDDSGNFIWDRLWDGSDEDVGCDLAVDSNTIYVTGMTRDSCYYTSYDVLLLKYDAEGNFIWEKTWGLVNEYSQERGFGVAVGSGDIYVTGFIDSDVIGSGAPVLVLKYSTSGDLIGNWTWGCMGDNEYSIGCGIVVDSGDVYVAGYTTCCAGRLDAFLLKLGDLIEKYKPVFIFHHEEKYLPVVFDAVIDQGFVINPNDNTSVDYGDKTVKYARIVEANPSPDRLDDLDINKEYYQLTFDPDIKSEYEVVDYTPVKGTEWFYIPAMGWVIVPMTPEEIIKELGNKESYNDYEAGYHKPCIYARVVNDEYEGKEYLAIEYWFYHAYNEFFLDWHEGEAEGIVILLDPETLEPIKDSNAVAYYQHIWKESLKWSDVNKEGTHPEIYVAKGSHASYFDPGIFGRHLPFIFDITDDENTGYVPELSEIEVQTLESQPWLEFKGEWCGRRLGKVPEIKGFKFSILDILGKPPVSKWDDPADCVLDCENGTVKISTGIFVSLLSPGYITVRNETGALIGYVDCNFTCNISNASIGTHGYMLPYEGGNYSMEIVYPPETENMTFDLEINEEEQSREAFFEDAVNATTIAKMNFNASTEDFIMDFDYDGDGETDESKLPDLIKESRPGEKSNSIRYLPSGGKLTLFIGDVVRKITIYAKDTINDALVEVKELEELPVIPPPGEAIYKNFSITKNFPDETMENAALEFIVNKSFIEEMGINTDNIRLFRYNAGDNEWEPITISVSGEGAIHVFYEANVTNLSYFALSAYGVNKKPIAHFSYSPKDPVYNATTIIFNASGSYDLDGLIIGYEWDFGDGAIGYGKVVNHAYSQGGNFTVTLAVIDNKNAVRGISKNITVIPIHNHNTGEGFFTMHAAIDDPNTKEGHTIVISPGTYNDNVDVYKANITLIGAGADVTIVRAAYSGDHAFDVTADRVTISGFTATGATSESGGSYRKAGIHLDHASYCNIAYNNASHNLFGILLDSSNNNKITGNTANSNVYSTGSPGIYLDNSHNNTLTNNNASNNSYEGICLCGSCYNTVVNNTATSNKEGFMIYFGSRNNTFIDNTATSNRNNGIIEWSQVPYPGTWCRDNTFINNTANDNLDGIWLYCASNNTLINNTAENNDHGIAIDTSSNNNMVTGNIVTNNDKGIYVYSSNNSKIYNNEIKYNGDYGIKMYSSFGNCIFGNAFISNNVEHPEHTSQAYDNGVNNWRSTVKLGYYYGGSGPSYAHDHYIGNYWSDYTGVDSDGDGIGDTVYQIDG